MGGEVGVTITFGKGSTFWFTVKTRQKTLMQNESIPEFAQGVEAKRELQPSESPAKVCNSKLRILVAEDDAVNKLVINSFLQKMGLMATFVSDGQEAVDYYQNIDLKPDLVLMDIQMPRMDGLQATKLIRSYETEKQLKPALIFALSANAFEQEVRQSIQAGMDKHLSKPINMKDFEREISTLLGIA